MIRPLIPAAAILLAGCSSLPDWPGVTNYLSPHRVDVRQGNFVTQEMVGQLKPGQTRDQVRFILGTPLVADQFHADRWDYIYRFQPGRGEVQQRRLAVYFDGNRLARLEGDVTAAAPEPNAQSAIKTIDIPGPRPTTADVGPAPTPAVPGG